MLDAMDFKDIPGVQVAIAAAANASRV